MEAIVFGMLVEVPPLLIVPDSPKGMTFHKGVMVPQTQPQSVIPMKDFLF